jgi:hypothetical protein
VWLPLPNAEGVYVTEQLLLSLPAGARTQLARGEKAPLPELLKLTVPPGLDAPTPAVSITVTVQALPWLTFTGEAQLTVMEVVRRLTVIATVPELAWWTPLPP